jgi:predicted P-loop ATPase
MTEKSYHTFRVRVYEKQQWAEATKDNPCPLCSKPDWCSIAESGDAVLCRRTEKAPDGWKRIKDSKDGYPIYMRNGAAGDYVPNQRQPKKLTRLKPQQLITDSIFLAALPKPVTTPQRKQSDSFMYVYSKTQWVHRVEKPDHTKPKGYRKEVFPGRWDDETQTWPVYGKGLEQWPPYRLDEVKEHGKGKWIIGVEGESCVEATRLLGLVAFTFQGGSWTEADLLYGMRLFKDAGVAGVIYIPDNDKPGAKKSALLAKASAQVEIPFLELPPTTFWTECPHAGDIADWVEWGTQRGFGEQYFTGQLQAQITKAVEDAPERVSPARSKSKQLLNLLYAEWGNRLRFNTMTIRPELDGEPLDMDTLAIHLTEEFDIDIGNDKAAQMVLRIAKARSYSPVQEYLERVANQYSSQDLSLLDDIATRYFGSNEPLHNVFMRKQLIGLVKRVFEPGCQHDCAVVLQGVQGIRKSTFWRTLAVNPDWFDDTITSGNNDKDERLKLRRFWILELAELESVFKRKEIASLRGFMTTKHDSLRIPYGRSIESFPRTSGFVGSVNPAQFLVDPEGHRRYWVIPVLVDEIPIGKLIEERDRLWAAAVHAYHNGETNGLTRGEEKRNTLLNKRHEVADSWQEAIEAFLEFQSETSISKILTDCIKLELGRHDRALQMRVAQCLKTMGWVKSDKKKLNGRVLQVWRSQPAQGEVATEVATGDLNLSNPSTVSDAAESNHDFIEKVATKVATDSNLDCVSNTAERLLPSPQFLTTSNTHHNENRNLEGEDNQNLLINLSEQIDSQNGEKGSNRSNQNAETQPPQGLDPVATSVATSENINQQESSQTQPPQGLDSVATSETDPVATSQSDGKWQPQVGRKANYGGETVEIIGYDRNSRKWQIELKPGRFQYVKGGSLTPPKE